MIAVVDPAGPRPATPHRHGDGVHHQLGHRTIEFVKADIPDQQAASNDTNCLITQRGLKLLIRSYSSSLALVVSQVAEKDKVIHWEVSGTAEEITGRGFKYVFRAKAPAHQLGYVGVDFVADKLSKRLAVQPNDLRIALVHEDSNFGASIGQAATPPGPTSGLGL